jgi:hypothetical protein
LSYIFVRIPDGLTELKTLLENHITSVGLSAIENLGQVSGATVQKFSLVDPDPVDP